MLNSLSSTDEQEGMQDPFQSSDDQILDDVYRTHLHCLEKCDVSSLNSVSSNVIKHSIDITEKITKDDQISGQFREGTSITSQQLAAKLKRIAYLMISTPRGDHYVHRTTMFILEQLRHYSWDAKALIVQAAFALEYGKFFYLPLANECQHVAKSLADLNGLLMVQQNKQYLTDFINVVKKVMQLMECITEWKRLINESGRFDIKDGHALAETLHEIPVVVYWVIFTFVTCTGQIDEFTDNKIPIHELSKNFESRLDSTLRNFRGHLEKCSKEIEIMQDYTRRKKIVSHTGKDIVRVLRALISEEKRDSRYHVYFIGLTEEQVKIEEFKKKHVLLFISGLENIKEDIQLLKSINEKLKEKPRRVDGYKSEDFKILWIPIVDDWNEENKKKLEDHLQSTKIGWYVVKYFNSETGIKLIKDVFKYNENPIIPLVSSEGKVENYDTKQIISMWSIDGFPFRNSDHTRLTQQWDWFWSEMTKFNPNLKNLIEDDHCHLFVYGGKDNKWIQEFTMAIETMKRQVEKVLQLDITIEAYQLGKEDTKVVPRFWIAIDSLLTTRRKQVKGGEGVQDFAITEIKKLLSLKQDPKGWVIFSKGYNVKLLGHGEPMCETVKDFGQKWHGKLHERVVAFDVALKEYYEGIKDKDCRKKCKENVISYKYPTHIVERIPCPNKDCRRAMDVTSVKYKCCHQDKES